MEQPFCHCLFMLYQFVLACNSRGLKAYTIAVLRFSCREVEHSTAPVLQLLQRLGVRAVDHMT